MTQNVPPPTMQQPGVLPMPSPVLSYAHAGPLPNASGLWRDGAQLVSTRDVDLGDACVKCGQPAQGYRLKKTLWWHHPALYLMIIFPGLLIYAIVALVVRKDAKLRIGLCPEHRSKRKQGILWAWLLSFAFIGAMVAGLVVMTDHHYEVLGLCLFLSSFALLVAAIVVGNRSRPLTAKKIDNIYAWFAGAKEPYLQLLPPAR
jgi:hypothetical protein